MGVSLVNNIELVEMVHLNKRDERLGGRTKVAHIYVNHILVNRGFRFC